MGLSFTSSIVIGYRLSSLMHWENRTVEVIRYHEKTGQPYKKTETTRVLVVLGKDMPEQFFYDMDDNHTHSTHCEAGDDLTEYVWGLSVGEVDSYRRREGGAIAEINVEVGEKVLLMVHDLATKVGLDYDEVQRTLGPPKIFLVGYCSY